MLVTLNKPGRSFHFDLSKPLDISIGVRAAPASVLAWYLEPPRIEAVVMGDWIGEVAQGASVNFRNIYFNPHGHGTHTECYGHISRDWVSLNDCLKQFFFLSQIITVEPETIENGDHVITKQQLEKSWKPGIAEAIIIRTLPNAVSKCSRNYSNTNPPYLHHEAAQWMCEQRIQHLLIDLPSVDREKDDGKLLSHHAFWNYPGKARTDCTITELIYVPDDLADGIYLLNLQVASFDNDASPSRPVLFKIQN